MAQFDVHRNRGAQREVVPYLVVVQTRRLEAYPRRLVAPLLCADALNATDPNLTPTFRVEGRDVVLNPLEMVSVPVAHLGEPVASLHSEGDRIIAAIDVVISRAFG